MDLIELHGIPRRKWRTKFAKRKWLPVNKWYRPGDSCPRCGEIMHDDSEYVDVGVGMVQVTYNQFCHGCGLQAGNAGTEVMYCIEGPDGDLINWVEEAQSHDCIDG